MTALNKQALREAAIRAGGGKWIYIRTLLLSSAYITEGTGATVINCTAGDVPAKCAGFLELANPATVLALLDELEAEKNMREAAEKRIAELEEKLANPVLLPKTNGYWTEQEKAYEEAITLAKRQVRLAGFRCEGDE